MTKRRDRGDGGIDERGKNSWRLRYRVKGKRITQTFHGSLSDARKELRRLLKSGDDGTHVAPDKITLGQWIAQWLAIGAPGRRQRGVGGRALARYGQLLRVHAVPVLGSRPLQQIQATELDALYCKLEGKVLPPPPNMCMWCSARAFRPRCARECSQSIRWSAPKRYRLRARLITARYLTKISYEPWSRASGTRFCSRSSPLQRSPARAVPRYWRCGGATLMARPRRCASSVPLITSQGKRSPSRLPRRHGDAHHHDRR